MEKTDRSRISRGGMENSREKQRHRKREWEIQRLVSHGNEHWQANSVDNVSVTERSNHSVLSQNQSPRICSLAKCQDVYSKQLKETYKERVSRQADPVTSLPLSPSVSRAPSRKCKRGAEIERRGRECIARQNERNKEKEKRWQF